MLVHEQELLLAFVEQASAALESGRFPAVGAFASTGGAATGATPPVPPPQALHRQSSAERAQAEANLFAAPATGAPSEQGGAGSPVRIGIDVGGVIIARCVPHHRST